jgi:hypothetical protein
MFVCAYGAILPTIMENALNKERALPKDILQITCQ